MLRCSNKAYRSISSSAARMAEGDTGGVRPGGQAHGLVVSSTQDDVTNIS